MSPITSGATLVPVGPPKNNPLLIRNCTLIASLHDVIGDDALLQL